MTTTQQRIAAVTNYTLAYFQQWHWAYVRVFEVAAAQLLLAAGRGPARVRSCEQTLRHMRFTATAKEDFVASRVILCALALLRAGELQTLRVTDPMVLEFILSAVVQQEKGQEDTGTLGATAMRGVHAVGVAQVLASLRAIKWTETVRHPEAAFALLKRYAANITELECPLQRDCDAADDLLARCTQVESLTGAQYYAPSEWLHLSQLHTLRGVDLSVVSTATIAAALPRLHTISAFAFRRVPAAALAGFFEDLLPRLQELEYTGLCPKKLHSQAAASSSTPLPLPHLRTLTIRGFASHPPPWTWFMGGRPLNLCADDAMIERWLPPEGGGDADATSCPLALVRVLDISARSRTVFTAPNVARLLRAAPQLETLIVLASGVKADASWLTHPASVELVHRKLRRIHFAGLTLPALSSDCLARLRERHFPRLQFVAIDGRLYFAPPLTPRR